MEKLSKSREEQGGPRTPEGKRKASRNAAKHWILSGQVLPEEEQKAKYLQKAIEEEFQLAGALELKIGRDLVQCLLQDERINKYAVQQFEKARLLAQKKQLEEVDRRESQGPLRFAFPQEMAQGDCKDRLSPQQCIRFLTDLKEAIERRGPKPDEDVATIALIFGKQVTPCATTIIACYREMEFLQDKSAENRENQKRILRALGLEITRQRMELQLQGDLDQVEYQYDMPALPADDACDRIQKHRAANDRKESRSLEKLEIIRRLKGKT